MGGFKKEETFQPGVEEALALNLGFTELVRLVTMCRCILYKNIFILTRDMGIKNKVTVTRGEEGGMGREGKHIQRDNRVRIFFGSRVWMGQGRAMGGQ